MRVDAHVHLIPDDYRAELERRELLPYPLPAWSEEILDAFMRRHGIEAAVLSLSPPGVSFGDAGLALDLARAVNERTARLVAGRPDRFAGLAVLPLPDVEAAIEEAAYALDVLGLDGVGLLSNVEGIYPGAPAWDPLLAELDRRDAYVFIHPTLAHNGTPQPEIPVWVTEFPFDTTRAILSLIHTDALRRHPRLRVHVPHLGGTAPMLAHRIASLPDREPGAWPVSAGEALDLLAGLYLDTGLSNDRASIAAVREVMPFERLVFGTDWPYAVLPEDGDPAPDLQALAPEERRALEGEHVAGLVARFVAGP